MIHVNDYDWRSLLTPIMYQAGEIILSYRTKQVTKQKKTAYEWVTEADLASEQYLMQELIKILPEAMFITEESQVSLKQNSKYCWVIDPLDGTTNFIKGLPYFCISVALTVDGKPLVGMIYQPLLRELFFVQQGKGAWLHDQRLAVSMNSLSDGVIAIGLPYVHSKSLRLLKVAEQVIKDSFAVRHHGAIALDLAYVAAGRLDGVLFAKLTWWDIAAGILLIEEAVGIVTDFEGNDITASYKSCIAAGGPIHKKLLKYLQSA